MNTAEAVIYALDSTLDPNRQGKIPRQVFQIRCEIRRSAENFQSETDWRMNVSSFNDHFLRRSLFSFLFFFFFFLNVASSLKRTTQKSINKRAFSRFPPLTYSRITHGYLRRFPSFRIHEIAGQQNHIFTCMHIFLISGASAQRLLACEN